jgi:hypothetical protein
MDEETKSYLERLQTEIRLETGRRVTQQALWRDWSKTPGVEGRPDRVVQRVFRPRR